MRSPLPSGPIRNRSRLELIARLVVLAGLLAWMVHKIHFDYTRHWWWRACFSGFIGIIALSAGGEIAMTLLKGIRRER